jgi:methyl-accepting chemotaxis protein
LLLFVIVALAVYSSLKSYKKVHRDTEMSVYIVELSQDLSLNIAKIKSSERGYLIKKNDKSRENYDRHVKNLQKTVQTITPLVKVESQKALLDMMLVKLEETKMLADKLVLTADKEGQAKAIELFGKSSALNLEREVERLADEFEKNEVALSEKSKKAETAALENIGLILVVGIVLAFLTSILISLLITKGITKHISSAINSMSSTSTEIAATVNQHERTAAQQASMVNETTTTIQELGASSRQTSEQASSAAAVAQNALTVTGEGAAIVRQALEGMNSLGAKVGMVADQILKLGEQTAQIGNLANMVKDLSSEINMLALNAAVEAARAGEHGKGFAVVAGEVRKLANESKKSAEQANAVIAEIQKATNATILRTEEGTRVVEDVTGYARNVGELFDSLSESSNKVYENAQQVMLNAKQQSAAIGQIVEAMNSLNTGARETAAGIVQTKTGIEQLNSAAGNLKQIL